MKTRQLLKNLPSSRSNSPRFIRLVLGGALMTSAVSSAATQYWDPLFTPAANGGKGSGGGGTFTVAGTNWSNGSADAALTNTNIAGFSGSAGTVTIASNIVLTAGGIQVDTSNYVIGTGTAGSELFIASQTATPGGIVIGSGVTGTSINLAAIRLGSVSGNVPLTNTDLVNFNNTLIYLSGSRTFDVVNSSSTATTTFAKLAVSDKLAGGTWPNAAVSLNTGNLTINSLAAASNTAGTSIGAFPGTANVSVNTTFQGSGSGTFTVNGDNTGFNNSASGASLSLTFNMTNGTLALGHNNALGSRNASNVLTATNLIFQAGTLAASGGARTIENAVTLTGSGTIGGSNALTLSGSFTNSGGSRTLTVSNSAATTLSGSVYLANDDLTARTLTIAGNSNSTISGSIANSKAGGTLASNLTKSGNGTLTLSSANSYSGTTTITAGILIIGNAQSLGNNGYTRTAVTGGTTVSSGGTLDLNGQTGVNEIITLNGTGAGSNGALINSSGTSASLAGGVVSSLGLSGTLTGFSTVPTVTISGGGGSGATAAATLGITAATIGTVTVTGTYTAAPTVTITGGGGSGATATVSTAGVITITNVGSGYTSAPTVTFTGGTGGTSMIATANNTNFTLAGIALTANGSGYTSAPTVSLSTGSATVTSNLSSVILGSSTSIGGIGDITINPVVSGGSSFVLTKVGSNKLTLAGANTYTGDTAISEGTVQAGVASVANASGAIGINSAVTLANTSGATLDITGFDTQVGSLAGGGAAGGNVTLGAATLTTGGADKSGSYAGVISGTGGLSKTGTGTQTLTGTNSYTGATAVNAGKVVVSGSIGSSAVTVTGGGSILASGTTGTIGSSVAVNSGAILAAGDVNAIGTATVGSGGTTLNPGSIFSWDLDTTATQTAGTGYDNVVSSSLAGSGAIFSIVLGGSHTFGESFWNSDHTWNNIFSTDGTSGGALGMASVFSSFTYANANSGALGTPDPLVQGAFTFTNGGSSLTWSAVPEPGSAVAGLLLAAGLLRRSRRND